METQEQHTTDDTHHGRELTGYMSRVSVRIPDEDIAELERLSDQGHYSTRSQAIRSAVADFLDDDEQDHGH